MGHFCGKTHSHRDRRSIFGEEERPRLIQAPAPPAPSHEQIAKLAYSYWEARGRSGGSAEADWFRAEAELKSW